MCVFIPFTIIKYFWCELNDLIVVLMCVWLGIIKAFAKYNTNVYDVKFKYVIETKNKLLDAIDTFNILNQDIYSVNFTKYIS